MKCVLGKEALLNGLQLVQNVVTTRTTLPILSNALLTASDGKLVISTTDLDTGIRATIEAEVLKPGSTTIPARRLFSIIRELPASELVLDVDAKHSATITSGPSFFRVMGLPEEDFPAFPKAEGAKLFKLTQGSFKEMLKRTAYAISTDESRYVLNGVLLSFKDGKLVVVATDGRRLALVEQELEYPKSSEAEVILPTKAVQELLRILKGEEPLQITLSDNQIGFDMGSVYLVSKLIEGNYPNYKQVVPTEAKERITLEREIFLNAVHRVALLSSEKSNSVKLIFGKNTLDITANTPEVGEAKESLPINYKGKEFTIAFNPNFLMDPLRNLESDTIFFDFIDELSPGVIKYNKPFLYVIMPMRTA
ncbi:MAG: DNA polymerase III subunit beta [Verrucomicrobia bacterium Tous-C9LFEB]|nr:MAG: DNA polymerase III subunit beta [Verrucomicrobia bacterium Tous-C9LFEB]